MATGKRFKFELHTVQPAQPVPLNTVGSSEGSDFTWYRNFLSAVEVGGRVYVSGGMRVYKVGDVFMSVLGVLDVKRNEWTWLPLEGPRENGCRKFLYGDSLYHFGKADWKNKKSGDVSRFDLNLQEWSYCNSTGTRPGHRGSFSGHFIEERSQFLVCGGWKADEGCQNDVYLLNMPQCHWNKPQVKGTPPPHVGNHGSCIRQGVFYCYGGMVKVKSKLEMFMLHFGKNVVTWSNIRTNKIDHGPASSFSMLPFRNLILLCGACCDTNQVVLYDPAVGEFFEVALKAKVTIGSGSATVPFNGGEEFLIFGLGSNLKNYVRLSVIES